MVAAVDTIRRVHCRRICLGAAAAQCDAGEYKDQHVGQASGEASFSGRRWRWSDWNGAKR